MPREEYVAQAVIDAMKQARIGRNLTQKELAKKMGWDIDIREDFLKDYIASRPKRVNLSEEEILAELNAIRYEK